ncbi:hypothetical protein [Adhaeribacter aquaticus]|uniref:hypothetical protein n=1 Tax=Adhaeribacter aquaticus TaxID=299567 RepID=UPI0003FFFEDD|nr:hypothetical protein [Adhaeribacter aquaticus]
MFQLFFTTLLNLSFFVNSQNAVVPNKIASSRASFTKVAPIRNTQVLNLSSSAPTDSRGGAGSWDDNN